MKKSFLELTFPQKKKQYAPCLSPPGVELGARKLIWLKYVQKWQIIFPSGLNTAKDSYFMEKGSSKSFLELNSPQKSQLVHMSISPGWSYGASKIDMVEI